jgi:segregation and condensation protein B
VSSPQDADPPRDPAIVGTEEDPTAVDRAGDQAVVGAEEDPTAGDRRPEVPGAERDPEPADADPPTEVVESHHPHAADDEPATPAETETETEPEARVEPEPPAEAETAVASEPEIVVGGDPEPPADGDPDTAGATEDLAPADADPPTALVAEPTPADEADGDQPPADTAEEELPELTDEELVNALEALLLVVDSPVEEEALAGATDTSVARVRETLLRLAAEYAERESGFDLRHAGGGWRFYTRDRYAPYVEKLLLGGQRAKLTRAALETLAVIAYRQPVTRARVAAVRGVNCDGVIRTLLARGLVEETGTDAETGGFLYRTTELFLERLGLSSLDDLPPIAPLLPEVDSIDDV